MFCNLAADQLPRSGRVCEQFPEAGRHEPSPDISSARCLRGTHRTGRWPGSSACTLAGPAHMCEVWHDCLTSHLVLRGGVRGQVGAPGGRVTFPGSYGAAAAALGGLDGLKGGQGRAAGRLSRPQAGLADRPHLSARGERRGGGGACLTLLLQSPHPVLLASPPSWPTYMSVSRPLDSCLR
jgi:hypothetical protein